MVMGATVEFIALVFPFSRVLLPQEVRRKLLAFFWLFDTTLFFFH